MTLAELIERRKIEVTTEFHPYLPEEIADLREALKTPMRWRITVTIGNRSYEGHYSAGSGHCKYPAKIEGTDIPSYVPTAQGYSWERQLMANFYASRLMGDLWQMPPNTNNASSLAIKRALRLTPQPVSYTHLTLPTKLLV